MSTPIGTRIEASWADVAQALFVQKGIRDGLWRLGVHLRLAGATGDWHDTDTGASEKLPAAIVGITAFGIERVASDGPMVFDAKTLNPAAKKLTMRATTAEPQAKFAPAPTKARPARTR